MIKATDIFRQSQGQRLDFMNGAVDVVDLFNSGILPSINALSQETGPDLTDPFIEQADQDVERSGDFLNALSSGFTPPGNQLGFERPTPAPVEEFPRQRATRPPAIRPQATNDTPAELPSTPAPVTGYFDPASFTFEREARRDSQGRLRVYNPPSGDGGGQFEVAGITARYQPKESRRLRALIAEGKTDEAEAEAKNFYRQRAAPFVQHASQPGLQLQLADSVHHRGEGGLRNILQRATGSSSKEYSSLIRQLDSDPEALAKFNDARVAYEMEETGWDKPSRKKFQKGLLNRFKEANAAAVAANERR